MYSFTELTARRAFVQARVIAIVAVVAIFGGLLWFGWSILDQAHTISKNAEKKGTSGTKPKPSEFSTAELHYLDALARRTHLPPADSWSQRRLLDLAARLNLELNARTPIALDPARTPWLLPFPATRDSAELPAAHTIPLDLATGKIDLPADAAFYHYSITNPTTTAAVMPIFYQDLRWDDPGSLIDSAGLLRITDEIDRAIAIWQLVATHRYHADPPTESAEEHDLIKFLSCHGYGFCDDSAQAVAALAQACNIQVRLVGLTGHVVPEIFADGKWRMLDPDFAVYFHAPGNPRDILGVEQLSKDRAAFAHPKALGPGGPYDANYAEPFLSTKDNGEWPVDASTAHQIRHTLLGGERIVFTNYNWGRPFLGTSPQRVPRYYNGYFELPLSLAVLRGEPPCEVHADNSTFSLINNSDAETGGVLEFDSPFPITGGRLTGMPPEVELLFEEPQKGTSTRFPNAPTISFDPAVAHATDLPTYQFRLGFRLRPKTKAVFTLGASLRVDFQFAEFALLKLKPGPNTFQTFGQTTDFKAELRWQAGAAK